MDISELPIYIDDGIIEINNDVEFFTKSGELRKEEEKRKRKKEKIFKKCRNTKKNKF
jgi:hypothetical protein